MCVHQCLLGVCASVLLGVCSSVLLGACTSMLLGVCASVLLGVCATQLLGVCTSVLLGVCLSLLLGVCASKNGVLFTCMNSFHTLPSYMSCSALLGIVLCLHFSQASRTPGQLKCNFNDSARDL